MADVKALEYIAGNFKSKQIVNGEGCKIHERVNVQGGKNGALVAMLLIAALLSFTFIAYAKSVTMSATRKNAT